MRRALLIPLVLLASCGGDDPPSGSDREQVTTVVTGYFDALAAGDGDAACEVQTEASHAMRPSGPARTLRGAVEAVAGELNNEQRTLLRDVRVSEVTVTGDRARVEARTDMRALAGPVPLVRADDGWQIADLPIGDDTADERADRATCVLAGMDEFDAGDVAGFWRREGRANYENYVEEVCRRVVARGADTDDARLIERIAGAVLRDMIRDGVVREP